MPAATDAGRSLGLGLSTLERRAGRRLAALVPFVALPLLVTVGWMRRPAATPAAAAIDARQLFQRDCAVCHGADAKGTDRGPTLEGWGRAGTDYALTTGRMPLPEPGAATERRPPKYDAATITALEDYIATLVPGGPDVPHIDPRAGDLATGGSAYRAQCAACHQWSGDGGALLHREAPPLGASTPTQVAEAVRLGPGTMPIFSAAALTDSDLAGVVRYVGYLDEPDDRGGQPLWHLGPVAEGAIGLVAVALLVVVVRLIGSRP
jgi:ubiquinol-cytochrome c reductase cytochrome c subunit